MSQGSAVRPRKPAFCPGQVMPPVFQICSGNVSAAGSMPLPGRKRLTIAPRQGQSFGAPGLAFSTLVGWCG